MSIQNLKFISQYLGKRKNLVQCAGGNTSLKLNKHLIIKSSGMWLKDVYEKNIFTKINTENIKSKIKKLKFLSKKDLLTNNNIKASIETPLHLLLKSKYVVHYHPVNLNVILIKNDALSFLKKNFKDKNWIYVNYFKPGNLLYKEVGQKLRNNQDEKKIIFLQNHGVFIGSETIKDCLKKIRKINFITKQKEKKFTFKSSILKKYSLKYKMKIPKYSKINSLATNTISYNICSRKSGMLFPDQVVFLGKKMHCITEQQLSKTKKIEVDFLIIKNVGVLISKKAKIETIELLLYMSKVLLRLKNQKKVNFLSSREIISLINWKDEKYRIKLIR